MYAVIESGGKQYKVQPGQVVQLEKLAGDVGTAVKFEQVLFSSNANIENPEVTIGKPYLSGAVVQGEIVGQGRGEKILIIKMKRRKQYRRTQGHRQELTQVLVTSVDNGAGGKAALSAEDKKTSLGKFQTQLKPRGLPMTPKTLGSRVRMANAAQAAAGHGPDAGKAQSAKPAAPKAEAAAPKKAPAKKAAPKK
jgi:large subunit ribosomal protein L21